MNPFEFLAEEGEEQLSIELLSSEEEDAMQREDTPDELAILPLRNTVLFPGVVMPINVGRDQSLRLIRHANKHGESIGVVAQKDRDIEDPSAEDLNQVGTVARIIKMLRMPDGSNTVVIQGKKRFQLGETTQEEPFLRTKVSDYVDNVDPPSAESRKDLQMQLEEISMMIIRKSPNIPSEAGIAIKNIDSLNFLVHFIASNMGAEVKQKQELLALDSLEKRVKHLLVLLNKELQVLELRNDIQSKVRTDLEKQQRDYYLQQQIKQIQEELGSDPHKEDLLEKKNRAAQKDWPENVSERFAKELSKLERMNTQSAEYSVQSNYIELMLDLPWGEVSEDDFDLAHAQKILDEDHYGLEKVKERIIEYLAVLKIKGDMKAPILCLYGPPGVGKTSLGKSIARAIGREYVRMSLGGMRDEAEIRGHRKTYIGAMPGRILQNIKKAGKSNPLFVLDEIDKLARDAHGDPSSAMLEVLDPEQNSTFYDNYLELDYDLSRVMFLATCNSLATIQPALRDRMEIIEVSGYTIEEKVEIAKRHLIPKHIAETGLKASQIKIPVGTLEKLCSEYTNESGVRGLEKRIAKLVRNRAKEIALEEEYDLAVRPETLNDILGASYERDRYEGNDVAGVVTGLAWTPTGGDILFIETLITPGKGKLTLTGNLGDVMKESAVIALAYLRAHAADLGLDPGVFTTWDVHIHVPAGAIPKDGPSAGVTMLTALASAFTQRKVRRYLAMTGEITLRGQVLPVGGVKEKILAARRAGIKEILLSESNRKHIEEIDARYLKGMRFRYVKEMIEVVDHALMQVKVDKPLNVVVPPKKSKDLSENASK
ncbi:MAG: endopeptidase La [Flavobacteriales bacterium]|nr:endopeptidase La [Flavobacteriales bacterium]